LQVTVEELAPGAVRIAVTVVEGVSVEGQVSLDVHTYATFVISCSCARVGLVVVTLAVYVTVPDPGVVFTVDGVTVARIIR
jgi:hypothetical protein